jgi:hypothetical protein
MMDENATLSFPTEAEADAGRDFLQIWYGRYPVRSTLLITQLPIASWYPQIGAPTVADSILDRLVHNAQRIELKGQIDAQETDRHIAGDKFDDHHCWIVLTRL